MAVPGSPWVHGQPQEGAIPTALVFLAAAFKGWADIPLRGGSNVLL